MGFAPDESSRMHYAAFHRAGCIVCGGLSCLWSLLAMRIRLLMGSPVGGGLGPLPAPSVCLDCPHLPGQVAGGKGPADCAR